MDASSGLPTGYLLTKLGQLTTAAFADRIEILGIRPKHYGLLVAIAMTPAGSQTDLGRAIGVVPSAIVSMLDDLETRGAVARVTDPLNRRRFVIELTESGKILLERARRMGDEVDAQLLKGLSPDQLAELHGALTAAATANGIGLIAPPS